MKYDEMTLWQVDKVLEYRIRDRFESFFGVGPGLWFYNKEVNKKWKEVKRFDIVDMSDFVKMTAE